MKTTGKEDGAILKPAYETPGVVVLGFETSVLCASGTTQDIIDNGDVDWFTTE